MTKDDHLAQWWADWWEEDYSWEGLGRRDAAGEPDKPWVGWSVTQGGECNPVGLAAAASGLERQATLQDYWRHHYPDLEKNLIGPIDAPDGSERYFTKYHLPFVNGKGNPTPKFDWGTDDFEEINSCLHDLLNKAETTPMIMRKTVKFTGQQEVLRAEKIDKRALFDGVIIRSFPSSKEASGLLTDIEIHLSARHMLFAGQVTFIHTHFGTEADFTRCCFIDEAIFDDAKFTKGAHFTKSLFLKNTFFEKIDGHGKFIGADLGL